MNIYIKTYRMIPFIIFFIPGFVGCIRFVSINDNVLDLSGPEDGLGLSQCQDNLACNLNHQCKNGATCVEDVNRPIGYSCICSQGYSGKGAVILYSKGSRWKMAKYRVQKRWHHKRTFFFFFFCISEFWISCIHGAWWKTPTAQIWWELVHGGPRYGRMNT